MAYDTPKPPERETEPRKDAPAPDAHARGPAFAASLGNGVGAYRSTSSLDLSQNRWEEEKAHAKHQLWNQTPEGRLAIRSFSRGILGAAFFAGGQRYATHKMGTYRPDEAPKNWVQLIAKTFDTFAGRPIELTANMLGFDGKRAVTFRPTRKYYGASQDGRSLGHEIVGVTFDFASMSVGDATGRDIAGMFDPNARLSWIKDGHIEYPKAARSLAMSAWRILSYNQGEDWAVALPYVYYLRAQRNMINKFSPGFSYDSDRNLNGASFKVNDHGRVIGNYNIEGMLDLQGRFTAYNIGTCMFREAYTAAADHLYKKAEERADLSVPNPVTDTRGFLTKTVDTVKHLARWTARDVVKGTIYMTPSMPFFWATRTPQTKFRGLFINPEKGAVAFKMGPQPYPLGVDLVHANEERRTANLDRKPEWRFDNKDTETFFSNFPSRASGWERGETIPNPLTTNGPDFTGYTRTFGTLDSAFNEIGSWNNTVRKRLHHQVNSFGDKFGIDVDKIKAKRFSDTFINASISYTPYFWSKAEFARMWDNAKMDQSIERSIDGATSLNGGEFVGGLGDMWNTLRFQPLSDPKLEALAQDRILHDISPADIFDPLVFEHGHRGAKKSPPATAPAPAQDNDASETAPVTAAPALPAPDPLMSEPYLRSVRKAGVKERMHEHKAHANSRMEQFKQRQPGSFVEAVKPSHPTEGAEQQAPGSFLEKEKLRQATQGEAPSANPTVH